MRESREAVRQIRQLVENLQEPQYFRNDHCKVCRFQRRCYETFVARDDLSLLGSISKKEIDRYNNHGLFTVTQLSYTFRPRKARKILRSETRPQYPLKALSLREKKTHVIDPPCLPTTPIEVFVDFEGLPDERFVYLVGMIVLEGGSERRESLWADSLSDADRVMKHFLERLARLGNYTMYHYGSFEVRALREFDKRTDNQFTQEIRRS